MSVDMGRASPIDAEEELGRILLDAGSVDESGLDRALAIRRKTGSPLGRVLVARGMVSPDALAGACALQWGLPRQSAMPEPPDRALIGRFAPDILVRELCVPLCQTDGTLDVGVARRPDARLSELLEKATGAREIRYVVMTERQIDRVVFEAFREAIMHGATLGLCARDPGASAFTVLTGRQFAAVALAAFALLGGAALAPMPTLIAVNLLVNLGFSVDILFRFLVSLHGAQFERHAGVTDADVAALQDDALPTYTVMAPLYGEARLVGDLLGHLAAIDYPPDKLEIFLLLEEDDRATVDAARAMALPGNVHLIVVPDAQPKTKPKACNVGLFFARGENVVIYDAEDRPEPDQLRRAVATFQKGGESVGCVQAALNYFNAEENFLTRMFTLEYSYWFDYLLPGLDNLGLPIPLGGTSNHFRTRVLRALGGWDPFNVTEDADLGMRASVHGVGVKVCESTTFEEANSRLGNWLRQRSRWIKGYMQTSLVELRHPVKLVRALGLWQAMGFVCLIAGTPLTLLAALPLLVLNLVSFAMATTSLGSPFPPALTYLSLGNLLLGNAVAVYLYVLAVFKRRYYPLAPWALAAPLYWVIQSVAAYKGLFQLFTRPFYWEKTEHGLSTYAGPTPTPAVPSPERFQPASQPESQGATP